MSYMNHGHGPALVASAVVPLVLTLGFSSVRIYVRWFLLRLWKIEDWLFVASEISFILLAVVALMAAIHGNGQKLASISPSDLSIAMQYWFAAEIFYSLTTILMRLSIGSFLLRICFLKAHIWIIRIAMFVMTLLTIVYIVFVIGQCHPINYFWLRFSGGKGSCVSAHFVEAATMTFSIAAAMTDLLFGILPIFVIWNLQMNPRAKAIVGGLLTLGILAGLTVIIRVYYVRKVDLSIDFIYATSNVSIWSMVEPAVGIICMASSTYRPLFKSLLQNPSSTTSSPFPSNTPYLPTHRSTHSKKSSHGNGSIFHNSRSGSLKSNHTKNSDSFDYEMGMDTFETTAEGPGKKKGRREVRNTWGVKGGIIHTTTVEIRTSERRMEKGDDWV